MKTLKITTVGLLALLMVSCTGKTPKSEKLMQKNLLLRSASLRNINTELSPGSLNILLR